MPFDRPDSPLPSRDANDALAELWRQLQLDDRVVSSDELKAVARRVSAAARTAGWRPEELIVAVKQSWQAREHNPPSGTHRLHELLNEVISLCIDEFYGAPGARRPDTDPPRLQT
jgi:hypothetical protein